MLKKILIWGGVSLLFVLSVSTTYGSFYYYKQSEKFKEDIKNLGVEIDDLKVAKNYQPSDASESDESEEATEAEATEETPALSTAGWLTYTNSKYGYTFKYPSDYVNGCTTKPCSKHISETEGGDVVSLQGDISTTGWPNITISHFSSTFYNPPAGTNLVNWISTHLSFTTPYLPSNYNLLVYATAGVDAPAVDFTIPASPQAYAERSIYYVDDDKLFSISMTDPTGTDATTFYSTWFENFFIN